MPCERPLMMWQPSSLDPSFPDKKLCVAEAKRSNDFLALHPSVELVQYETDKIVSRFYIDKRSGVSAQLYSVGCGRCFDCRMKYALNWANRLMIEKRRFPNDCYFLTLSYDDDHLTHSKEMPVLSTLVKKDTQDFHKRLRFALYGDKEPSDSPYRFFLAGEYGDTTFRPHYHEISFNLPLPDLKVYTYKDGYPIYTSKWLTDIWQNGEVWIEDVTAANCAYVARYCEKKQMKDDVILYDQAGIQPEFTLMSRRPGIGGFSEEFVKDDSGLLARVAVPGGKVVNVPRYFDKFADSDESLADVKRMREWRSEQFLSSILETKTVRNSDFIPHIKKSPKKKQI